MVITKVFFILTNIALLFHDGRRCEGFTPTEKDVYENENEKENENENENTYDGPNPITEDGGEQTSYTQEDSYEAADNYDNTEPFDPEKSGFLIHEYFDRAYEKHPDYDTATMKLNLNYFGDVLIDKTKDDVIDDVTNDESKFTLDPEESKTIIKEQPEEDTGDIQERENDPDDNDKDDDNDEDDEKIEPDTDNYTDKKQAEEKDREVDWIDNVGYESLT